MMFAQSWQRLVKTRYTGPAREHAKHIRDLAERGAGTPGDRAALLQGASHIDRLANMLDELVRPVEDLPLRQAEELRAWIIKDMHESPDAWRAALGGKP